MIEVCRLLDEIRERGEWAIWTPVMGGFLAVVLDEVMGLLLIGNVERDRRLGGRVQGRQRFRGPVSTRSLKVDYVKPCPTPGVVLARAVLSRVEGEEELCEKDVGGWGGGSVC